MPMRASELKDQEALAMINRLQRIPVQVPEVRGTNGAPLMTAVVGPTPEELAAYPPNTPAIIMLHSFDSSCLEFRR